MDQDQRLHLVYGQMNEPPGARARVALSGLTLAEYFRDKEGQDVLILSSTIFSDSRRQDQRFQHYLDEYRLRWDISQHLATDMGNLQERITTTSKGSITSVQAIYVPADDLTDPAPATSVLSPRCNNSVVKTNCRAWNLSSSRSPRLNIKNSRSYE